MTKQITLGLSLVLALAFVMGGTVAFAQSASVDGSTSTSYTTSIKPVGFLEKVKLFLTFNPIKRADTLKDFSNRNFELAKQKLEEGDATSASTYFKKSNDDTKRASDSASRIEDDATQQETLTSISDTASNRTSVLEEVRDKVENPKAQEAIDRALEKQAEMKSSVDEKIQSLLKQIEELKAKIKELEKGNATGSTGSNPDSTASGSTGSG